MNTLTNLEMELLVYENLLAALEECKPDSIMARFFISIEEQLRDFEEDYPEVVSEYRFIHKL